MRYHLRTLMIILALGSMVLASGWLAYKADSELIGYAGGIAGLVVGCWLVVRLLAYLLPMLRFSIRDVMWLMVVVGLAWGWFGQWRIGEARVNSLSEKQVEDLQGLTRHYQADEKRVDGMYRKVLVDSRDSYEEQQSALADEIKKLRRENTMLEGRLEKSP